MLTSRKSAEANSSLTTASNERVAVRRLGLTEYETTWRAMQAFTAGRTPSTRDEIWLTEHPPVYTLGLAGRREHLLRTSEIPAIKVDRGGQITYHGPGQLVAYLLFDLRRTRLGVRDMVRAIEHAMIEWLASVAIEGYGKTAAPGVYVDVRGRESKLAALGLKVRNGCTYHGLAMNVAMEFAAVRRYRSLRLSGTRRHAARRSRRRSRRRPGRRRARTDSRPSPYRIHPTMTAPTPPLPDNAAGVKHRGDAKTARVMARIPIQPIPVERLKKPDWIRVRAPSSPRFYEIKKILREHNLHTVCEEASCPNIGECFSKGTATFMIMGDICTRRCPFCDVGHGRPLPLDADEPVNLARTIAALKLRYVVITSVDRDDLRDGGAQHFVDCIRAVREHSSAHADRSARAPISAAGLDRALAILRLRPPDVMNHNLEQVPRLYRARRAPVSDYTPFAQAARRFHRSAFPACRRSPG
jgi:lipoate-protein ligase B